jgi:pyruvate,water dikinase
VGGKSASLGEMIGGLADAGVPVPGGFSTTAQAYKDFLLQGGLGDRINAALEDDGIYTDVTKLQEVGKRVRQMVMDQPLQAEFEDELKRQWERVSQGNEGFQVAVRSSATAEDLPDASFAGQQETYLNVSGYENLKEKVHQCYASLFTDRAISYRHDKGFDHRSVQLCACVQKMVRSETASAGVMFTLDTESGFNDVVFVTSAWGLGETVVGGTVNPDEFYVFKPTLQEGKNAVVSKTMGSKLVKMVYAKEGGSETIDTTSEERAAWSVTDEEVTQLAQIAMKIEKHYGRPMDIEWCKDADDGQLYVVQARPETVASRQKKNVLESYSMEERGNVLCEGRAVGGRIGSGKVNMLTSLDAMADFKAGDVLVADMTDPDWEPVMSKAAAIITNRGGRTCHAAIIARELGIPAIVGSGDATEKLKSGDSVTVSCAEGGHRLRLRGGARVQEGRQGLGGAPRDRLQDHDERGQPLGRLRVRADPERGHRPRPPGVRHQQCDRHPPEGAAQLRQHRRRHEGHH